MDKGKPKSPSRIFWRLHLLLPFNFLPSPHTHLVLPNKIPIFTTDGGEVCGIFKCLHLCNTPSIPPTSRNKKNLTEPRHFSSFADRLARFHCIILLIFARLTCSDLLYLDENMRGNKQALLVINMFPRFMISYGRARCDTVLYIASLKVFFSGLEGRRPVEFVVPPLFRHSHVRKHFPFEKNQRTCQLPMKNGKRIIFT